MSLNIDHLLADLESHVRMEKTASEKTPEAPAISEEVKTAMTKQAGLDVTAMAVSRGEEMARELLTKVANKINEDNGVMAAEQAATTVEQPEGTAEGVLQGLVSQALSQGATTEDRVDPQVDEKKESTEMAKQASEQGAALAEMLLQKVAEQLGEAPVVNNIQADQALAAAQKEQAIAPAPEGTANQILQALVANAQATGAGSDDMTDAVVAQEGAAQTANPAELSQGTEVEKAAAVSALVGEGIDFESAVAMIKEAGDALAAEADDEMQKAAAVSALVDEGIGFDDAISLVKAAELELTKEAAFAGLGARAAEAARAAMGGVKAEAGALRAGLGNVRSAVRDNGGLFNKGTGSTVKALGRNRIVQGAGAVAGAGALAGAGKATYDRFQEKKAAFDALIDAGIDFEEAASLVKAAELQVYGE